MFGLTNSEGNHGEDAKEYWFYLDSTPTHSYMKCRTSIRSPAFPYDGSRRDQRAPRQARTRVRAARHRGLRRGPLLRRLRRVRQGRARRHPDARHRAQPRTRRGDAARAADAVVPQHLVVGRRRRQARRSPAARRRAATRSSASGTSRPTGERLFCENETKTGGYLSKSAINDHWSRASRSGADVGHECAAHHVLEIEAAARRRSRSGSRSAQRTSTSTRSSRRAEPRPTRSTLRSSRRRWTPTRAGDAPGARGSAVGQAVLRVRRPPLAARARRQPMGSERRRTCATSPGFT